MLSLGAQRASVAARTSVLDEAFSLSIWALSMLMSSSAGGPSTSCPTTTLELKHKKCNEYLQVVLKRTGRFSARLIFLRLLNLAFLPDCHIEFFFSAVLGSPVGWHGAVTRLMHAIKHHSCVTPHQSWVSSAGSDSAVDLLPGLKRFKNRRRIILYSWPRFNRVAGSISIPSAYLPGCTTQPQPLP